MIDALRIVMIEQITNLRLIRRLARYEVKSSHAEMKLGMFWEFLNPMIQIMIYWFVFGVGLRGNAEVGGVPFFVWMITGFAAWMFINDAIPRASNSINSRLGALMKLKFPLSVIPSFVIASRLYQHLIIVGVVIVLNLVYGIGSKWVYIQLPYYIFANIVLVYSLGLLLSTLVTLVKDVHPLITSFLRMFFYVTPILWTLDTFPAPIQNFIKLNPFYYLIEGYRNSLTYGIWVTENLSYTIYFWSFTLLILLLGTGLHIKFRKSFSELV